MSDYRRKLMLAYAANKRSGDIIYPGLIAAWSAKGKTNDDADRATLKDLTGNGHDITLEGFAFSKMGGYGGYPLSFKDTKYNKWISKYTNTTLSFTKNNQIWRFSVKVISSSLPSMKVNIEGIKDEDDIEYHYYDGTGRICKITNLQNGEILLPESKIGNSGEISSNLLAGFVGTIVGDNTVTITLLPEYPDALVFDGVDDYGINDNMPILTDYTIIAKRKWIGFDTTIKGSLLTKRTSDSIPVDGAFVFEEVVNGATSTRSFGDVTPVSFGTEEGIVFQTKNIYNSSLIKIGTNEDSNKIAISRSVVGFSNTNGFKGAFYSAYLFNRSLDEQEIKSFIRKYIDSDYYLPSEVVIPDCYYDFSQGSNISETREIITDYSGNGNDAKAYNFSWSDMSGYGGYNLIGNGGTFIKNNITGWGTIIETHTNKKVKFKITGVQSVIDTIGNLNVVRYTDDTHSNFLHLTDIFEDGIYEFQSDYGFKIRGNGQTLNGTNQIIIEEYPEYEGALVLDGVDDYIALEAFNSGFKTMFMVCANLNTNIKYMYDQRENATGNDFALFLNQTTIAYNGLNVNGTYINNVLNTKVKVPDLIGKKHLIHVVSNLSGKVTPIIGGSVKKGNSSNLALYKFLGFKEKLTEEQIQYVIEKYNLLDGVDEIEVS